MNKRLSKHLQEDTDIRWTEYWVRPWYGESNGLPDLVLAFGPSHALEQCRVRHPTANTWELMGEADPEDIEKIKEGSPTLMQELYTYDRGKDQT